MRVVPRAGIVAAAVAAVLLTLTSVPASAASSSVSTTPATWTPQMVAPTDDAVMRQLTPCGGTMFAAGAFSTIRSPANGGTTYRRHNAFSFSGSTGRMTSFNPDTNGVVDSIALSPDCRTAYLGGTFTSVGGHAVKNIAAVDAGTGGYLSSFAHSANGEVSALLATRGHVLAGGYFTTINGTSRAHLASLNATTGAADSYLTLGLTGTYPGAGNSTRAFTFALSPAGSQLLVNGVFTAIGGVHREQVAELDLGSSSATLDGWTSKDFYAHCSPTEPFWIKASAYSPTGGTIYTAATGYRAAVDKLNTSVCDAAAAYPNQPKTVSRTWVNYTGCDSLYAVAADSSSVYVAGHERWADNPNACNHAGSGAVSRPGIGGLDPGTGLATSWNPTRDRGRGADDLVIAFDGLWVASDNWDGSVKCGGATHPGICFFPY